MKIIDSLEGLAVDIGTLNSDPANARTHDKKNIDAIKSSLARFGQRKPIVVRKAGMIVEAGNGTLEAARELGATRIAAVIIDESATDATAYALTDNRTAELAAWDDDVLKASIAALDADDFDLEGLGWDNGELDAIMTEGVDLSDPSADEVPEAPSEVISKLGDVWILGGHRLVCGDSTDADTVALVLDGDEPYLMVTDPPYGVDYDPGWRSEAAKSGSIRSVARSTGAVLNDDRCSWLEVWGLSPAKVFYCWHASGHASVLQDDIQQAGFEIRNQIIWGKPSFAISRGHYNWQHESCWYAIKKGSAAEWIGDHSQSTLWSIKLRDGDQDESTNHSTQKPVECMARAIRNHAGDVYEPFSGSGTTIIACEMLGRKCYAIELSPEYVDIAVARWEKFTGQSARRLSDGSTD